MLSSPCFKDFFDSRKQVIKASEIALSLFALCKRMASRLQYFKHNWISREEAHLWILQYLGLKTGTKLQPGEKQSELFCPHQTNSLQIYPLLIYQHSLQRKEVDLQAKSLFPIPTLHNKKKFRPILRQKFFADFSNFSPKFFGPKLAEIFFYYAKLVWGTNFM